ncbi:KAP family P-loop NTPase fold protein [Amycolatopsis sp. NPDC003865]
MENTNFFSDDPIKSNGEDRIGRLTFAGQIAEICEQVGQQSKTSVMALIGPWGSGKSSLLELSKNVLESRSDRWNVVNFNPWLFSDIESLLGNYFSTLKSALPEDKGEKAREKLANYAEALSPLGKLASLAGFDASGIAKKVGEVIRGDTSIDKRRQGLEEALEVYDKKILVVIDDIDRLQPQELLLIFKLIRLIGRLPNIYYILAYDERTVLGALQRSDLVYENAERAHDYLEKIVQIRLDLPPLHPEYQEALIDEGLENFFSRFDVSFSDSDQQRFGWVYHSYLKDDLREPRAINRFIAQLYAMYALVHGEVDVVDFLILTFLRTFYPGLYGSILANREELVGQSLRLAARRATPEEKKERWLGIAAESRVPQRAQERILNLLVNLFSDWFSGHSSGGRTVRSVQNGDYFDRYFHFGVPQSDIPDSIVLRALAQMPDGDGDELRSVVGAMQRNPSRVLRKISAISDQGALDNTSGVFAFLAGQYSILPPRSGFLDSPDVSLQIVAMDLLVALDKREATRILMQAIDNGDLTFVADITMRAIRKSNETGRNFEWVTEIKSVVVERLEQRSLELGRQSIGRIYSDFPIIYRLNWLLEDKRKIKEILWDNIRSGEWDLIEVLGRLVSEGVSSGGTRTIFGLEESAIEDLLGINAVVAELGDVLDREGPSLSDAEDVPPTKESKEIYALSFMRVMKRKHSTE